MRRFAVIATKNRNDWCKDLVVALNQQKTITVVVDNNVPGEEYDGPGIIRRYEEYDEEFNYSRALNIGLNLIGSANEDQPYIVACLNDDLTIPDNFMDECESLLLDTGAAVAFPGQGDVGWGGYYLNQLPPGTITNHSTKMTGFAHVAMGNLGIRFDQSMKIWYSDNDYEMQARQLGGTVMATRLAVKHHDANGNFTRRPYWQEQAGRDRETFKSKWGFYAWT